MEQIRTKPANKKYRKGYDNIKWVSKRKKPSKGSYGEQGDSFQSNG